MQNHPFYRLGCAAAAVALLVTPAYSKPGQGKGHGGNGKDKHHKAEEKSHKEHNKEHKKSHKDWKSYSQLDNHQRDLITNVFRSPSGTTHLPPGLAKNLKRGKPLPPGWQKKLVPGSRLDDDLFGSFTEVPHHLIPGFKVIPDTRLYYHENRIVRLLDATREIIDVVTLR